MVTAEHKNAMGKEPLDREAPPLPPASDGLLDLRSDWLTSSKNEPKRKNQLRALWSPDLGEPLLATPLKRSSSDQPVKATIRRIKRALLRRYRRASAGNREWDAGQPTVTLFAIVAILLILGALFYTTALHYILSSARN